MKKITMILCLAMCAVLLGGCVGTTVVYSDSVCASCGASLESTEAALPVPEGAVKTGLAIAAAVSGESATAEKTGKVSYDVTFVAVNVDEDGRIVACVIDSLGADVPFDAAGNVTGDIAATLRTKNELGEDYGMKAYAGAKYEWNEQAAALASYAVGKTVEELRNGAVSETGYAKDADLASTATIHIAGFVDTIEKAVQNARYLGAQGGDVLKLASVNSLADSAAGSIALNCDVTALTMNGDTITSCDIDALQATVAVEGGTISTDLTAAFPTKNELGEAYGMKAYAGARYEWNEQAANFAAYVTGKTAQDVAGIAVTEDRKPADADLAASVTIAIGGFQGLIAKAAQG